MGWISFALVVGFVLGAWWATGTQRRAFQTKAILRTLHALHAQGEAEVPGLQILEGSGGLVARGSLYVMLSALETMQFVESRLETPTAVQRALDAQAGRPTALRRRFYRLTKSGRAYTEHTMAAERLDAQRIGP